MTFSDLATPLVVILGFAILTFGRARSAPASLKVLHWLALAEYFACALVQGFFMTGDASGYRHAGFQFSKLLDISFSSVSGEFVSLLLQQPSIFDPLAAGGTNTGSMVSIVTWLMYVTRRSEIAVELLVAGLALQGALGIFGSLVVRESRVSQRALFVATVLFPSVAFWCSGVLKESFCMMGMGMLLTGWRLIRDKRVGGILWFLFGVVTVALFRALALPPLGLGLAVHFVVARPRGQKARRPLNIWVGTLLAGVGLAAATALIGHFAPALAPESLADSVARQQKSWTLIEAGGSSFGKDLDADASVSAQATLAPLALINALFRPQLFDVTSAPVLVSALEMTFITWLFARTLYRDGPREIIRKLRSSPMLAMCAVVLLVGGTFVGLTTRNFGSLARYRVPFMPFYGALLAELGMARSARRTSRSTAPVPARAFPAKSAVLPLRRRA